MTDTTQTPTSWQTLRPAAAVPLTPERIDGILCDMRKIWPSLTRDQMTAALDAIEGDADLWINDTYQVDRRFYKQGDGGKNDPMMFFPPLATIGNSAKFSIAGVTAIVFHLSIKRVDREPIHDWRDLQRMKNQLVGKETEAVELYPAESRVVDTANQYHLWGQMFPSGAAEQPRIMFGWQHGGKLSAADPRSGTKQRPIEGDKNLGE